MPPDQKDQIRVTCPRCGYAQSEPRLAYSTICKNCQQHFRIEDALRPKTKASKLTIEQRKVRCFQCGTELEAPKAAASTMCKRCSAHVDLSDYRIAATVSKNFRTHGWLVVEEKGYLLNTDSRVGEAVVKGRLIGKLVTEGALEIHTTANIKGQFSAGRLVVPSGNRFRWPERLQVGSAEIGGELVADLVSQGTIALKSTARLFGNVTAANLVVEAGAVFVGEARIGQFVLHEQESVACETVKRRPPQPRKEEPANATPENVELVNGEPPNSQVASLERTHRELAKVERARVQRAPTRRRNLRASERGLTGE
jgi:cytoskeletal protein CcmA (bactofilin family)